LPFEDASFDVVIAIRLLTHLDNWEVLLAEMCRVAKDLIIVEYPSKMSLNAIAPLLFKFKKKFEGDTRTFRLFSDSELKTVLKHNGYESISRKGQFFFPLVVHRMLKSNGFIRALEAVFRKIKMSEVLGSPVILSARKKH
jgi:ubiquinone/menaquinone biosynthesis C-methylase UbiE